MTIAIDTRRRAAVPGGTLHAWQRHGAMLAFAWAALLLLFRHDVGDLAEIYWNSTTYGHCLFVLPVVGWLVWQRREDLAQLTPQAWWPGLAIVAGGAGSWFLGDAAAVGLLRHVGLVLMLQGSVVALLGLHVARGVLFPLAYLGFLVPFGDSLVGPLQDLTVAMIVPLLALFGVPAAVDGVLISIPNGYFEVAEACSGAKFLIAMLAYGALVANVCFVSWKRRAAFLAMAIIVPILANGLRAFGTIYAAWLTSVEAATGADHIVYGWVFFAVVMALVLALAWRWFDRDPDARWFAPERLSPPAFGRIDRNLALAGVLGLAVGAAAVASLIAGRADRLPDRIELPEVAGWTRAPMSERAPWQPHYPGADHFLLGRYVDGRGAAVDLAIIVYSGQREGKEVIAFGQGAIREEDDWVRIEDLPGLQGGSMLRMTLPGGIERETGTWYRVGDALTASANRVKLETLRHKLLGGPQAAVAIHVSAERDGGAQRATIERFLADLGPLDRLADRAAGRAD